MVGGLGFTFTSVNIIRKILVSISLLQPGQSPSQVSRVPAGLVHWWQAAPAKPSTAGIFQDDSLFVDLASIMMRLVVCCLRCAPQPLRLGDNLRSLSVGVAIWKPPRAARLRRTRTQSTPPGVCTAWRRAASASAGTRQGVESESVDGIAAANVSVREDAHARVVAEAAAVEFSDEAREAAEHAAANQAWLLNELEALDPPSTGTGQGGRDTPGKENAAQDDVQPRRSDRKVGA